MKLLIGSIKFVVILYKNIKENKENKDNIQIKEEDFDSSKNIRKFKKAVRRINKLKKLYHTINQETNEDLDRLKMNKKCTCEFVILFIVFSIAILTDFLLPIALNAEDDFTKSVGSKNHTFDSIVGLIVFMILIYPFSLILSSYTVMMIYTTKRKNYISEITYMINKLMII